LNGRANGPGRLGSRLGPRGDESGLMGDRALLGVAGAPGRLSLDPLSTGLAIEAPGSPTADGTESLDVDSAASGPESPDDGPASEAGDPSEGDSPDNGPVTGEFAGPDAGPASDSDLHTAASPVDQELRPASRPLGLAPLLDSEPLPATRPGMLRPRQNDGFSLPSQRPAFDIGPEEPVDIA
jgi:arginase